MPSSDCAIDTPVQSPRSAHQRSCRARHASTASALGTSAHPPRSTRQHSRSAQHASTAAAAAPDTLVATQRQQQATQRRPQKDRHCAQAPHRRVLRLRPSYAQQTMQRHFHPPHNRRRSASFTPPSRQRNNTPQKTQKATGTAAPTAFAKSVMSHTFPKCYEMRLPASGPAAEVYTSSTCTKQPPFDFTGMPI